MEKIMAGVLMLVGLINLYPAVGVFSAGTLSGLYRIDVPSADLLILLRHRAVLFGMLGGFIIYSAFRPALQWWAIASGLVSMLSFIALAFVVGNYGSGIRQVVLADVVASAGLFAVMGLRWWSAKP